jgi:hypothetical protein
LEKSREWGERIPVGIIYKTPPRKVFASCFRQTVTEKPLAELMPPDKEKMLRHLSKYIGL